jgi:hypothetical protein
MTVWGREVKPHHIPMPISRSSRPNTADLQPQLPSLSTLRFKHELFKHVGNPIVELNDIPRARAPGDVVHMDSNCRALTRHSRGLRYRRRKSRPARMCGSLIAPLALPNTRGALCSMAKHTVRFHRTTFGRHVEFGLV